VLKTSAGKHVTFARFQRRITRASFRHEFPASVSWALGWTPCIRLYYLLHMIECMHACDHIMQVAACIRAYATCILECTNAIRTRMVNTVGDGVVQSWHFGWQPVLELTCDQVHCPGSKWLLFSHKLKEFVKGQIFWWWACYLHGKWLVGRPRTTILLQWNQSFREILDQVHFSCRKLCWKVTKYDVCIS